MSLLPCAVFVWKCTHFELPVNSVTVQPVCYCRAFLNTSCFLQNCWRAAGFVYRRTVVWREVGKISFSPSGPFLCIHSQAAQPGISRAQQELFHLCNALVSPVQSLFFLSRTTSLLLFLVVSWGFAMSVWIGSYSMPIYRMVILGWEMLNWNPEWWGLRNSKAVSWNCTVFTLSWC